MVTPLLAGEPAPESTAALLQTLLSDENAGWTIGTFGALAEFHHVENDPVASVAMANGTSTIMTSRGGMKIVISSAAIPLAYEGLSARSDAWTQAIAFCLPATAATMGGRTKLTELSPDYEALRSVDCGALLFDMGLGAPHIDFCIRTSDGALIEVLRREAGTSLLAPRSRAMAAIVAASPHRVCLSRLGRIEVYQPIPPPLPGALSPIGPHTHVLPELLKLKRTHSANVPLPPGAVAALTVYPANPVATRLGEPCPFDPARHHRFQAILRTFGPPSDWWEKEQITRAVLAGEDPLDYPSPPSRSGRLAARVALRQLLHVHPEAPRLPDWLAAFEHGARRNDACR